MLLPPKKLKDFLYYEKKYDGRHHGNFEPTHSLHLYFSKKLFWLFEYEKRVIYNFPASIGKNSDGQRVANASKDYLRLRDQLDAIVEGTWKRVPLDVYEKMKAENPELFL